MWRAPDDFKCSCQFAPFAHYVSLSFISFFLILLLFLLWQFVLCVYSSPKYSADIYLVSNWNLNIQKCRRSSRCRHISERTRKSALTMRMVWKFIGTFSSLFYPTTKFQWHRRCGARLFQAFCFLLQMKKNRSSDANVELWTKKQKTSAIVLVFVLSMTRLFVIFSCSQMASFLFSLRMLGWCVFSLVVCSVQHLSTFSWTFLYWRLGNMSGNKKGIDKWNVLIW